MVLGDNGWMDKVKHVCKTKQEKNTRQCQCKVGHYKQLDNLPLPVQPQLRPWSARPRRGATSRAIWSDKILCAFYVRCICSPGDKNIMQWDLKSKLLKVFATATSFLSSSSQRSSPTLETGRSADSSSTGGPTLPNMGRWEIIYQKHRWVKRPQIFFSNPSPDTGLWRPWIEEGEYLEIGDSLFNLCYLWWSAKVLQNVFVRWQSKDGHVKEYGGKDWVLEVNMWRRWLPLRQWHIVHIS